jgi:hypothetical protein
MISRTDVLKGKLMKKITESLSESLKYLKLYRDDIEQIYDIFKGCSENVSFTVDNYELDTIKEVSDIQQDRAKNLELRINEPSISITVDESMARIYISKPDSLSLGMWARIKDILTKRQNKLKLFYEEHTKLFYISYFLGWFLTYILARLKIISGNLEIVLYLTYILSYTILTFFLIVTMNNTVINLVSRKEAPPFLKRNRDEIILAIVSLVIGAVLGHFIK